MILFVKACKFSRRLTVQRDNQSSDPPESSKIARASLQNWFLDSWDHVRIMFLRLFALLDHHGGLYMVERGSFEKWRVNPSVKNWRSCNGQIKANAAVEAALSTQRHSGLLSYLHYLRYCEFSGRRRPCQSVNLRVAFLQRLLSSLISSFSTVGPIDRLWPFLGGFSRGFYGLPLISAASLCRGGIAYSSGLTVTPSFPWVTRSTVFHRRVEFCITGRLSSDEFLTPLWRPVTTI